MKRKVIVTADGSSTIQLTDWNEQYHSLHGAIQEAEHVYIKNGLNYLIEKNSNPSLSILEIGFGTGLNCLLTAIEGVNANRKIWYTGVDAYPISKDELSALNYPVIIDDKFELFHQMHACDWEKNTQIHPSFSLIKTNQLFEELCLDARYDLIYYDAFGARVQPELWTVTMFKSMYKLLNKGGVLVTYAAKGSVRRALIEVGFSIEKLKGPPGKREMLRGVKN